MTTHRNSKLGTTSGVFLPSLLTIVGAIMFLRLGWIIQHGGLIQSIWIVITAFAMSLITGCCLSSIATDKKIQDDGIYHILTRSLGLPMGSTICIMMTLALIFSAALQIIGISESLLDISKASNFLHIAPSAASYRIIGSILLLPVFALVMISRKSTLIQKFKYVSSSLSSLQPFPSLPVYLQKKTFILLCQLQEPHTTVTHGFIFSAYFSLHYQVLPPASPIQQV